MIAAELAVDVPVNALAREVLDLDVGGLEGDHVLLVDLAADKGEADCKYAEDVLGALDQKSFHEAVVQMGLVGIEDLEASDIMGVGDDSGDILPFQHLLGGGDSEVVVRQREEMDRGVDNVGKIAEVLLVLLGRCVGHPGQSSE